MKHEILNENDLEQIQNKNIIKEKVISQIEIFKKGFPFTILDRPCLFGDGIIQIEKEIYEKLLGLFHEAESKGRITKFVPASGAATRMFKVLQSFNNKYSSVNSHQVFEKSLEGDPEYKEIEKFIKGIRNFAFFDDLKNVMLNRGINIREKIDNGELKEIITLLLNPPGLNYSNLPKGLLKFHNYSDGNRTAFEEHIVEGANYAKDKNGKVRLHFTVSPEYLKLSEEHINSVKDKYEGFFNASYEISYSIQKPETDTIAVDLENNPFRNKDGSLVFRPAGHGALIENLNDLKADIIFIKNIDNVVPDYLKETTYLYKKLLGGFLLKIQEKIFNCIKNLTSININQEKIDEYLSFLENELYIFIPQEIISSSYEKKKEFILLKLNRPIRVCGIVKNTGEPGGGPFWVKHTDGTLSLQLVETSQIDIKSEQQKNILNNSTHFSPVDIVCSVRNSEGKAFNLPDFVDPETGFISIKSKDGKDLKALELPGLWNGAMSNWNTFFVEVPLITFNPVKTINDLLRKEHQNNF